MLRSISVFTRNNLFFYRLIKNNCEHNAFKNIGTLKPLISSRFTSALLFKNNFLFNSQENQKAHSHENKAHRSHHHG